MAKFFTSLKKDFKESLSDYLILLSGSAVFLFVLSLFRGQRIKSLTALIAFIVFFILWSIRHHTKEGTLNHKIVLEYIFIGVTIFLLLLIVFLI